MIIKNNKWMLPKEAQEWIFTNISEGSTILELGSGYGTEELSKKYKMYSIEHDPNWIGCFNSTYIKAEIKNRFYNISEILDKIPKNIDLLIIDGPPSALGNRSKFLDVMSNFSLDFPIIINDANRNDEMYLLTSLTGKIGRESWLHTSKDGRKFGIIKGIKNKQINIESKTESIKEPSIIDGISVIISAYNTQDFIEECLDSVANQKTNLKYEVLLGIDGCKETLDKVKSIMSKYNNIDLHVYYSVENVGTYILCNSLIEKSKFNYFTRFDSDDIMKENHIEYNIKFLKDYNVVYPKANILNESRVIPTMGLVFMDKKIFLDINGYDNFRISGDNDLKERLKRNNNKIKDSDTPTLFRRILPNSLEHSKETNMQSELRKKINNEIRTRKVIKIDNLQVTKLDEIYEDPKIDGISVIISAYKSVEFIEECLDSVANQKTNFEYEVLLGIDGCEETLEKVKTIMYKYNNMDFHVYYSEENVGTYLMFNSLITYSKYNYFTVFGADDIMLENHLEENIKYLKEYNCIITKGIDFENNVDKNRGVNRDGIILLNKNIFNKINGYDVYRCGMDTDLLKRLKKENIKICRNRICTYKRRLHNNNLTKNNIYGYNSPYRIKVRNIIDNRQEFILNDYKSIELKKIINSYNIEFGYELLSTIPNAYELSLKNELGGTISGFDTECLYYFSPKHNINKTNRSWENTKQSILNNLPYIKIHAPEQPNKVFPPYKEIYKNNIYKYKKPILCICNRYNIEWSTKPINFFDENLLDWLFINLKDKYEIIYFSVDIPEQFEDSAHSLPLKDIEIAKKYEIKIFKDLCKNKSWNNTMLNIFANCENFITMNGGYSIMASMFKGTNIIYSKPSINNLPEAHEIKNKSFWRWYSNINNVRTLHVESYEELKLKVKNLYIDKLPTLNIIIRTHRPNYLKNCMKSIEEQTYPNINIIFVCDNEIGVEATRNYNGRMIRVNKQEEINEKPNSEDYGIFFPYNLYIKDVQEKINDGYILILDDDDMFTNKYAVEIMMNNVKEDKVLIWKVDFKKFGIKPNESFNKTVQLFDIGAIGFCYHISQIKHTDWSEWKRGDYRTAKKLEENIGIIWLDEILTGIQDKPGKGIKQDIIN